jgi:uncharacterized protein YheU (UPF0270 family)
MKDEARSLPARPAVRGRMETRLNVQVQNIPRELSRGTVNPIWEEWESGKPPVMVTWLD